ncbi:hypothetical protein WUBG_13009 [Wuchereria bancrofti]|uniref:Uncharacterized protein n=1 Tax=Wuchereria bancrofti TaxID=6293 RepID=J9E1S5_WUCBA|nr:hypothetical protein WUBG_13009 [Wuchereria bancrofti]
MLKSLLEVLQTIEKGTSKRWRQHEIVDSTKYNVNSKHKTIAVNQSIFHEFALKAITFTKAIREIVISFFFEVCVMGQSNSCRTIKMTVEYVTDIKHLEKRKDYENEETIEPLRII